MNQYQPEGFLLERPENREKLSTISGLESAMRNGDILEAVANLCDSDLRLHVDLHGVKGIIDAEEAFYCRQGETRKEIAIISRVGKPIAFKILSIEKVGKEWVAHLSRRVAQKEALRHFLTNAAPGDLIPARVTHMEPFGAFLDIGCGISTLLSVDCISVSRIAHPKERLSIGQTLTVAIKQIDSEGERLSVTLRELLGTWEENASLFHIGQTVTGIIRSVENYGIFIELAPNLAGLAESPGAEAEAEMRSMIGKSFAVYIKSIVPDRMKVKLVLVDGIPCPPPPKKLTYFIDPSTKHLDCWTYSPPTAKKLIQSIF